MLLIYSIGRCRARHQISFPSVFCPDSQDWTVSCGGAETLPDTDYLVFGEIKSLGGKPFLAIETAVQTNKLSHFAKVFGRAGAEGVLEGGLSFPGEGEFAGELVAVDQGTLVISGGSPSPAPSRGSLPAPPEPMAVGPASPNPEKEAQGIAKVVTKEVNQGSESDSGSRNPEKKATGSPSAHPAPAAPAAPAAVAAPKTSPSSVPGDTSYIGDSGESSNLTNRRNAGGAAKDKATVETVHSKEKAEESPLTPAKPSVDSGGAGEGEPVPGTSISVFSKADQVFPESGPLPELAGVKRSELARKADARKKTVAGPVKTEKSATVVSSSGMRLGKDLGGDKKSTLVQNKIDEDELW